MSASPPPRLKVRPLPDEIDRLVRKEMRRTGTPGVAVGILHKGHAYAAGYGVTTVAEPAPVDHQTLFQIGSTGKTFTTTAIMRLVDRGDLDLDEPIRRYIKNFSLRDASVARRVTLRHLLTHTGGWAGDYFIDTGRGDDALAKFVHEMRTVPQLTPLGSAWHYNNAGFCLAGHILATVAGVTYEEAIRELVLEPLGMTRSFHLSEELLPHRTAIGHVAKGTKQVPQAWWGSRSLAPAGGLVSDVVDQLRWASFHLGDGRASNGKRLLKRATMREMQDPQAPAGALADHVGLSWLLEDAGDTRLVSHGGTTIGQLSTFSMVPSEDLAVTTLTNSTSGRSLNRAVVAAVLARYAGIRRKPSHPAKASAAELRAYRGRYVDGFKQVAIALEPAAGSLRGTLIALVGDDGDLPVVRLALFDTDRAVHIDKVYTGLRAEFLRSDTGRLTWLRFGGRLYRRVSADPGGPPKRTKRQRRR
ncbi:MAG: serine hydrolase domain-containing protein [Actinomycetota bacterium]